MTKDEAIELFGSVSALARALDVASYFDVTVEDLFGDEELDFDAIRLARAIESLPTDKKGHLSAVVDAFVN